MNIQRANETGAHKNTDACIVYEYELPTGSVNAAVIDLSGRYPDEGWALNTACTALIHVIKGHGTISTIHTVTEFATGDQVLLMPDEKYTLDGTMKLLYIASPAWTPAQARHIQ